MTPTEAGRPASEIDVKANLDKVELAQPRLRNLELRAKHHRKYPPLNVGDTVKIMRKKKVNEKERSSFFSDGNFTVEAIAEALGQKYYKVGTRDYLRAELLKIG
jgi:hypothetical protein